MYHKKRSLLPNAAKSPNRLDLSDSSQHPRRLDVADDEIVSDGSGPWNPKPKAPSKRRPTAPKATAKSAAGTAKEADRINKSDATALARLCSDKNAGADLQERLERHIEASRERADGLARPGRHHRGDRATDPGKSTL